MPSWQNNPLFRNAAKAVQDAARAEFRKTTVGKLVQEVDSLRRMSYRSASTLDEMERKLLELARRGVLPGRRQAAQYAKGDMGGKIMQAVFSALGPLGSLASDLFNLTKKGRSGARDRDIEAAVKFLQSMGFLVYRPGASGRVPANVANVMAEILRGAGWQVVAPGAQSAQPATTPQGGSRRGRAKSIRMPQLVKANSSNVWAYGYDPDSRTLIVQYKAPTIAHGALKRVGKKKRLKGTLGRTIVGKANRPGPLYHYFNVPPKVFERMKEASSKGTFVWDTLRVRGTMYGHKYDYKLAAAGAGVVVGANGPTGQEIAYVPRKAVADGVYKARSIAIPGRPGRVYRSILPSQGLSGPRGPSSPPGPAAPRGPSSPF